DGRTASSPRSPPDTDGRADLLRGFLPGLLPAWLYSPRPDSPQTAPPAPFAAILSGPAHAWHAQQVQRRTPEIARAPTTQQSSGETRHSWLLLAPSPTKEPSAAPGRAQVPSPGRSPYGSWAGRDVLHPAISSIQEGPKI